MSNKIEGLGDRAEDRFALYCSQAGVVANKIEQGQDGLGLPAPLVGGMADIMTRIGISWNTWNKIANGQPVRYSVGERFKARIVANADEVENLRMKFPATHGGIDRDALSDALLLSNASKISY